MIVNGQEQTVAAGMMLLDYLKQAGYNPERIAVEKNGSIVPKNDYDKTVLQQEDTLEVVQFVGGG
ncbi:MAG: sulfur carrier protein ThiS [Desulfotomaculaceae bacterium]|nr:sulfur carrier protein ThiS [Desulfotomaculaceae bacterium]MDD4766220.1 sulfur carrier protein ThiS [Desulfotomaculaceae bacterium]